MSARFSGLGLQYRPFGSGHWETHYSGICDAAKLLAGFTDCNVSTTLPK